MWTWHVTRPFLNPFSLAHWFLSIRSCHSFFELLHASFLPTFACSCITMALVLNPTVATTKTLDHLKQDEQKLNVFFRFIDGKVRFQCVSNKSSHHFVEVDPVPCTLTHVTLHSFPVIYHTCMCRRFVSGWIRLSIFRPSKGSCWLTSAPIMMTNNCRLHMFVRAFLQRISFWFGTANR